MSLRWRTLIAASLLFCLPMAGRGQVFERTDSQKEIELGRQVQREVEKEIPLSENRAYIERVKRIGDALIKNLPQKVYPYEFKVLSPNEINAFSLPGGFIYVYEGLLARMPNDNAVAWVMAHELAHASMRHWHKIVERTKPISIIAIVAGATTGQYDIADLAQSLVWLAYTRDQEEEADRVGLEYMWEAGYDTQGAVDALNAIVPLEKGNHTPTYLRDHPRASDRLKKIEEMIAGLKTRPRPTLRNTEPSVDLNPARLYGKLPDAAPTANPWFPLAVGNEWTYAVGDGPDKPRYRLRVVSAAPAAGGTIYRAETTWGKDTAIPCQLLTSADGLWRRNRPGEAASAWSLDAVLSEGPPSTRDGCSYTVEKSPPVELPCGRFNDVIKVRRSDGKRTYDLWFARNTGLIKRACVETGVVETLAGYKVQQGVASSVPPKPPADQPGPAASPQP